jgi:ABC-2 type transport system ATP-binding protein
VFGVDSKGLSPKEFQRIGYVSENQLMPLALTVGEYLNYVRPFYLRWDRGLERLLLQDFGLPATVRPEPSPTA